MEDDPFDIALNYGGLFIKIVILMLNMRDWRFPWLKDWKLTILLCMICLYFVKI